MLVKQFKNVEKFMRKKMDITSSNQKKYAIHSLAFATIYFQRKKLQTEKKYLPEKARYYLGKNFPGVYLTRQEARCMVCFMKGFTYKKTAEVVGISFRTVSSYALNMRRKLLYKSTKNMINEVKKSDLLYSQF